VSDKPFQPIGPTADTPRHGDRIDEVWAWCVVDPADDCEGIIASVGLITHPLIGADRERIESFRFEARAVAQMTGQPVKLVRFGQREVIEEVRP